MANNAKKEKGKEGPTQEELEEKFRQGLTFRAKLIGIDDVPEARGDKMCQEKMQKLKAFVKASGTHKQRILISISLEGLQIRDQVNHTSVHTHPVHRISFIARDVSDHRAFGYIFGPGDGTHKFYAIKTEKAAESVVLALRDLFQVVFEMKKKEIEGAKEGEETKTEEKPAEGQENVYQVPQNGAPVEGTETVYQVPTNNTPVAEPSNLVDLEDQLMSLQQGIEQINILEDAWATTPSTNVSNNASKSSLDDLDGLSSNFGMQNAFPNSQGFGGQPFGASTSTMSIGGPFAPTSQAMFTLGSSSLSQPGFGMPQAQPTMAFPGASPRASPAPSSGPLPPQPAQPTQDSPSGQPTREVGGLPIADDPFADDPFSPQPRPGQPFGQPFGQPGFPAPNPFGATPGMMRGVGQPMVQPGFGVPPFRPGMPSGHPFPGAQGAPGAPSMGQDFFPPSAMEDPNILQPQKQQTTDAAPAEEASKPKKNDPFGDLVDIGGTPGIRSPKQLFEDKVAVPKRSLNELKVDITGQVIRSTSPKFAGGADPFGAPASAAQPAQQASDPFAPSGGQQTRDPFAPSNGQPSRDPFAPSNGQPSRDSFAPSGGQQTRDPFAPSNGQPSRDPFAPSGGKQTKAKDPFSPTGGQLTSDPFGPLDGSQSLESDKDPFDTSFVQVPKPHSLFTSAPPPLPPRVPPQPALAGAAAASSPWGSTKGHSPPVTASQNVFPATAASVTGSSKAFHIPSPTEPPPPLPATAPPPPPPRPRPQPSTSTKPASASAGISPPVPKPRKSVPNSASNGLPSPSTGSENRKSPGSDEDLFSFLRDQAWDSLTSQSDFKDPFAPSGPTAFSTARCSQGNGSPASISSMSSPASAGSSSRESAWPGESTASSSPWPDSGMCSNGSAHEDMFSEFGKKGSSPFDDIFAPQNGEDNLYATVNKRKS